jgi:ribose transport system permease protein
MTSIAGSPSLIRRAGQRLLDNPGMIIWIALLLLLLLSWIIAPSFMDPTHLLNVTRQAAGLGIVAIGQTIVLLTGGLDLSLGMIITLVDVIAATVLNGKDTLLLPVMVLALAIGMGVGLINGLLITKLRMPAFVVTLGMSGILRGAAYVYTNGAPKGSIPPALSMIGNGRIAQVPIQVLVWLVLVVLAALIVANVPFGRQLYAVGGNARAARLSGVRVDRVVILAYVLSGLSAAVAGLVLAGYIGTGSLSIGNDYSLNSIAAAVLGGTAFTGGVGTIMGSAGGALFLTFVVSLLRFLGLAYRNQLMVQGAILALAIFAYSRVQR